MKALEKPLVGGFEKTEVEISTVMNK